MQIGGVKRMGHLKLPLSWIAQFVSCTAQLVKVLANAKGLVEGLRINVSPLCRKASRCPSAFGQ
jgi:hypothetical protein